MKGVQREKCTFQIPWKTPLFQINLSFTRILQINSKHGVCLALLFINNNNNNTNQRQRAPVKSSTGYPVHTYESMSAMDGTL